MKKIILLVVALCVCLPSFAKDQKHKLEIGYSRFDYGYREPHTDRKDHFTAKKWGIDAVYTLQSVLSSDLSDDDPSFASLEVRYANGATDTEYEGHSKTDDNIKNHSVEAALKIGRKYQLGEAFQLRPYLGIGWREARRGEEPYGREVDTHFVEDDFYFEENVDVYASKTTYFYIPIGSHFILDVGDALSISLNGEFDWLVRGRFNAHAPDFYANSDNLSISASKGYGVFLSAKAELDFGPFGVFAEPFWRYWKVQRSSKFWYGVDGVPNGGYSRTPFNITREYGIRAGITF